MKRAVSFRVAYACRVRATRARIRHRHGPCARKRGVAARWLCAHRARDFSDNWILTAGFCLAMVSPLDESTVVATSIGNKIRALRQRLKLTLDEASAAAGISKPFLSQVERGRATPSITSLVGIARALGVTMQYFVDTPTEAKSICRSETLQYFSLANSANAFARLTNVVDGRQLDAILVRLPAAQTFSEMTTHAGEEFLYVLAGDVELKLADKAFMLKTGDAAHYESTTPHAWRNGGASEAVVVWVGTPRLF
ncbi:Transcriptional regulator, XRE family [Burkholderia singularis]|uniref:Transcriptional regulator, XRE family n=2 Tax=Burkholderia singularis TaxID=1503053 RepID=A0A238H1A1_9BURK|nr:Transcriptional regulator, XRE family [Burkholderia singularis]